MDIDDYEHDSYNTHRRNIHDYSFDEDQRQFQALPAEEQEIEAQPTFLVEPVEYKPPGKVKHLAICNNIIAISLTNNQIAHIVLKTGEQTEVPVVKGGEDQIHKIFLDPTGNHLIISMNNEDNYYLFLKWQKPKLLHKMKGILIESVAWNKNGDSTNTREILIGSNKGKIYETVIESNEKAFMERLVSGGGKEQPFKQVYSLPDHPEPIAGLKFEAFVTEASKFFVLVATPTHIYQFIGGPTFEQLFQKYEQNPSFLEMPAERNLRHSQLAFYSKFNQGLPKSFAWLTGPGIYFGDLVFGSQNAHESVLVETDLLPYPPERHGESVDPPLNIILTEFHFILLFKDKLQVISTLSREVVWQERKEKFLPAANKRSTIQGLAYDPIGKTAWLYTDANVFEIIISHEDQNVWSLYLQKGQFESALEHCKTDRQRDKVWTTQADFNMENKEYKLAAACYGKTKRNFEEIALKFYALSEHTALRTYLGNKLKAIKQTKNATQATLIATWLTEIYLDKLNELSHVKKEAVEVLEEEFENFLRENQENLDKATTFNLMASHGRMKELLSYAMLIKDYKRVITYYVQQGDYKRALDILQEEPQSEEMYYEFSPTLMANIPYFTVNVWIRCNFLEPRKLLPSLMRYDHSKNLEDPETNQAIRYLQGCVKRGNRDPAIHDYLLSLYVQERDQKELVNFIQQPERLFDLKYALRLCLKEGKTLACVLIYSAMEEYEEAVDLALEVSIEMAKDNANQPEDVGLRKKLWLKIAKHLVEKEKNTQKAMELLKQCDLLKIEDILPFFPDFTHIDQFKDEICLSLEDYNNHIESLKAEMEDATRSADLIRKDIKELRNKHGSVGINQSCNLCKYPALSKDFYLFPCGHVFHSDCLGNEMDRHMNSVDRIRVKNLNDQLSQLSMQSLPKKGNSMMAAGTEDNKDAINAIHNRMEKIKEELDGLIASECVLCGEVMILSIREPFVSPSDPEYASWKI